MNLKLALASLILGSSSIAMAQPAAPCNDGSSVNSNDYDDDYTAPVAPTADPIYYRSQYPQQYPQPANAYNGRWLPPVARPVTLAAGVRVPFNGRTEIRVGGQLGSFAALKLDGTSGRSFIRQVYIQFENGQTQVRDVNRMIDDDDCVTIDLDGNRRHIRRVIVLGGFARGGWGWRRHGGTFNVTAI
jgi:hypothetical protein